MSWRDGSGRSHRRAKSRHVYPTHLCEFTPPNAQWTTNLEKVLQPLRPTIVSFIRYLSRTFMGVPHLKVSIACWVSPRTPEHEVYHRFWAVLVGLWYDDMVMAGMPLSYICHRYSHSFLSLNILLSSTVKSLSLSDYRKSTIRAT